ncbi:hypothetical protein B0J17DRAFT_718430 [Rhizoctonia solani]|nr:hypothetical protein B0J17DRAFT_718430 [Rhizoctonia solani]
MAAKAVALIGANGFVGKVFAKEFLKQGFDLRILACEESIESAPLQEFKSHGASLRGISYDDEASIFRALRDVDIIVSTVTAAAVSA